MNPEKLYIASQTRPGIAVRIISAAFGLLVIGAGLFFGFFVLMAALIFGLAMATIIGLRIWWIHRKLTRKGQGSSARPSGSKGPSGETIEGEFKRVD